MTPLHQWDLGRYYYTGLDDPRLEQDIDTIADRVDIFVKQYKDTFHTFHT